jgi:XTP/dITP diphosphohydrolase
MKKLLIATHNKGKALEILELLKDTSLELVTPYHLGFDLEVEENGVTYLENATKKAVSYAEKSGLLTLADDSGLEVESLDGKPGIYSARFSRKPGATDSDRRRYLLEKLRIHPKPWKAEFKCVVALHQPGGKTIHAVGLCAGEIIADERGSMGFGYDPIFLIDGFDQTMAELSLETKNKISHRARAIQVIKPVIINSSATY